MGEPGSAVSPVAWTLAVCPVFTSLVYILRMFINSCSWISRELHSSEARSRIKEQNHLKYNAWISLVIVSGEGVDLRPAGLTSLQMTRCGEMHRSFMYEQQQVRSDEQTIEAL